MKKVYKNGQGEIVEKKSRFIAHVFSVKSEDEAMALVNQVKKEYWDARHNCYAFVLGNQQEIARFSDDGEPSGTAGKPILEVIQKEMLTDCLIVVTRYFGGTLLGTGGLVRAYQASSKEGLAGSVLADVKNGFLCNLMVDYNSIGKIGYLCAELEVSQLSVEYAENVQMQLLVSEEKYQTFEKKLTDAFSGQISPVIEKNVEFAVIEGVPQIMNT